MKVTQDSLESRGPDMGPGQVRNIPLQDTQSAGRQDQPLFLAGRGDSRSRRRSESESSGEAGGSKRGHSEDRKKPGNSNFKSVR